MLQTSVYQILIFGDYFSGDCHSGIIIPGINIPITDIRLGITVDYKIL